VRGATGGNFRSDVTGNVPLGGGLRTHFGNFTADARVGYNVLFDQGFAMQTDQVDVGATTASTGGRYMGTLNVGTTF